MVALLILALAFATTLQDKSFDSRLSGIELAQDKSFDSRPLEIALAQDKEDVDAKIKEFSEAMKAAKSDADRVRAIDELAAVRHLKAASKLTTVISGPFSGAVRAAAAEGVGRIGEVKAGAGLQTFLGAQGALLQSVVPSRPDDQKAAEAAVRALGTLRDHSAVRQLSMMTISANIPLMAEVCRALGKIRDLGCMDHLLKLHYAANSPESGGLVNPRKPLAPETLAALRSITGQKLTSPDEWNKWWRANGATFRVPPEEAPPGLPPDVKTFAAYSGKGETAALRKFGLVLVDPANYTKDELSAMKAIAISGEPKAAMEKGCAGFVVTPEEAADARKKFPIAIIVVRGDPTKAGANANAALVEGLDPKKPDAKLLEALKDARSRHDVAILALFVGDKKDEIAAATKFARDQNFLVFVAPDKEFSALPQAP